MQGVYDGEYIKCAMAGPNSELYLSLRGVSRETNGNKLI
jgi:hypothetical protein